jgi:hypothetical protein
MEMIQSMKRAIATLLVFMVACDLPARSGSQVPQPRPGSPSISHIEEQVRQIPPGAFIEAQLTDKSRIRGYLSAIRADGFDLRADTTTGSLRQTAFSEVKSVRMVRSTHTPAWAWVAAGAIVAVVVIVVVVFAVERHNE